MIATICSTPMAMASFLVAFFALDDQHRNAVYQKDHVLPIAVSAIVDRKLFGDFKDIIV